MKIEPRHLFYILTLTSLCFATLIWFGYDHADPDLSFVFGYSEYSFFVFVLGLVTSAIYFFMHKINKPMDNRMGYLHFTFISIGILLSVDLFFLYQRLALSGAPDTTSIATDSPIILVAGPLFLLVGLLIFIYGLIKTFNKKTNT